MENRPSSLSATPLISIGRPAIACHYRGTSEHDRLVEDHAREQNWKRWGPYLADRQWGTVREDYSGDGKTWEHFPHDHARSRAYRWGEDGLLGITDRRCRICFSWGLWNGQDPILKERLFGLTGPEGNHGEDVKELYYYLDSTPTHSYMRALYKYPQKEYPYDRLVHESRRRSRLEEEFELEDTGIFDDRRYFDFHVTYAKATPDDLLIQTDVVNRGPEAAWLDILPTIWFRNTWRWPTRTEGSWGRPNLSWDESHRQLRLEHSQFSEPFFLQCDSPKLLGDVTTASWQDLPLAPTVEQAVQYTWGDSEEATSPSPDAGWLFTENETNRERLYGRPNPTPCTKDAFHDRVVGGDSNLVSPHPQGTKAAVWCRVLVPAGAAVRLRLRFADRPISESDFGDNYTEVIKARRQEAEDFYRERQPLELSDERRSIQRQSDSGLLWTKQFYHYIVSEWLDQDNTEPDGVPAQRTVRRNEDWPHLFNRDVISMPDKWEYPWYAAWDSAFHALPLANLDPNFAKEQMLLFLREWYMHSNGQLPAYEWAFDDVNPPVHAWACWQVFQLSRQDEIGDIDFLKRVYPKLLINFTWWVNRTDPRGKNLFSGGFLGLDNIGVFDRSRPLPTGGFLEQADGTAWMAFFCRNMLTMSLQLGLQHPSYADMASKFFEHYMGIAEAMNLADGRGLWDEQDGFYYDHLLVDGRAVPLRVRSIVGLLPLISVQVINDHALSQLQGFQKRMQWFLDYHESVDQRMTYLEKCAGDGGSTRLLAIPSVERLRRLLKYMLDEEEFLSPYGIRSLSKFHEQHPYRYHVNQDTHQVTYLPGESDSGMFGGNSNWRGPVWLPLNYLLIDALERYHQFYGDSFKTECPVGSGIELTLGEVASELRRRIVSLFEANSEGVRPSQPNDARFKQDPGFNELALFHEYFHAENGKGLGASHQTGWTSLVSLLIDEMQNATPQL